MDKNYHAKIINDIINQLDLQNIDAYLIITSEGSDHIVSFVPGVGTVGSGAFLFTASGQKIAICSKIDAQDIEKSGLFDRVCKYENYTQTLADIIKEIAPKRLALNFSLEDSFCDGLTVGRFNRFANSVKELPIEYISADCFMPSVVTNNKR